MPGDYRTSLVRRCQCGHPLGDHAYDPPHRCLSFDRTPPWHRPTTGWPTDCPCQTFQETTP